jgi:hypothetical protein
MNTTLRKAAAAARIGCAIRSTRTHGNAGLWAAIFAENEAADVMYPLAPLTDAELGWIAVECDILVANEITAPYIVFAYRHHYNRGTGMFDGADPPIRDKRRGATDRPISFEYDADGKRVEH